MRKPSLLFLIVGVFVGVAFASTTVRDYIIKSSQIIQSTIDSSPIGQTTPAPVNATEYRLNGALISLPPNYGPTQPGRSANTDYTNTGNGMIVSGALFTTGSGTGNISCLIGPSSPTIIAWAGQATATVNSGSAGFICPVPAGWHYKIVPTSAVTTSVQSWVESPFN